MVNLNFHANGSHSCHLIVRLCLYACIIHSCAYS